MIAHARVDHLRQVLWRPAGRSGDAGRTRIGLDVTTWTYDCFGCRHSAAGSAVDPGGSLIVVPVGLGSG
jgi:hypothetical protein